MQTLPKAVVDALQFEEKKLQNGLVLRVLPMPEYGSVHAMYSTHFGSINRTYQKDEKKQQLPAGVAHFLEHKMFENEDGVDAFSLYAETGASANAYTSFDRTCYIFTATDKIDENLDILLSFVSEPHFTKETVAKEQGIIGQEIKMYEDIAELRTLFGVLECLYHNHPIRDEIVGTVETISDITPEMLFECCDAYYNPANMVLTAAGNITMEQLMAAAKRAGLHEKSGQVVETLYPQEPDEVVCRNREIKMEVSLPVFGIGFKEKPVEGSTVKTEVVCDMLTELICGETSLLYRRLYDEGLVQPGFGGEYGNHENCLHFVFSGESPNPEKVKEELFAEIKRQRTNGVDEKQFEICKKMMYGAAVADLESVEKVASILTSSYFRGRTPAEEMEAIASITLQDIKTALDLMLDEEKSVMFVVQPLEN